jgi:ATP phosphoribosyltransferase regulatory subunit
VVFDAYCEGGSGLASASILVARGGRYDDVGKAFGRARPATGFSIDLRSLAAVKGKGSVGRNGRKKGK